jgi:uncharacterized protein DUF1360
MTTADAAHATDDLLDLDAHADQYRPLGAYAGLVVAFNASLAALLVAAERQGRLPDRYGAGDLGLMAVATFKLSRLIAKDRVTSALRAPFTRFQEDAGHGEVSEAARGRGLRRALGELLVCDYCMGQWVAAGLVGLHAVSPRPTRTLTALFTTYAAADALQLGWSRLLEAGD